MEQNLVKVPFEVEIAKKITNGDVEGRIVTRDGRSVRVLCWDRKGKHCTIIALIEYSVGYELLESYRINGSYYEKESNNLDLMLEIPEYMTFKDGDIIKQSNDTYTWLSIIKDIDLSDDGKGGLFYLTNEYVYMLINDGDGSIDIDTYSDAGQKVERATEAEKQKLIDTLKTSKEPKAKEYLKRFFGIEQKQEYEFKTFDKVIVRDDCDDIWQANIFSHKQKDVEYPYRCINGCYHECIPYNEQTAHLIGTIDNID